ncbi:MAG: acetolactate synthase small subunit [Campylobacterales bacterium]
MTIQRKIISVEVVNEHGVLARIAGLFAGRGYNIETLTVAPIPGSNLSRITIETFGSKRVLEQIVKQLNRLVSVLRVIEHDEMIEKEMAIVRIPLSENLAEIDVLARAYNGRIVNVGDDYIIAMVADRPSRIEDFLKAVRKYHPSEIVKSGIVAVEK